MLGELLPDAVCAKTGRRTTQFIAAVMLPVYAPRALQGDAAATAIFGEG